MATRAPRASRFSKGTRAGRSAPGGGPGGTGKRPSDLAIWFDGVRPWVPLIATVFGGAAVYLLSRVEAFQPTMGLLGGLAVIIGGPIYGLTRPEDAPVRVGKNRYKGLALAVACIILAAALFPFVRTNFKGTPHFEGTLSPRKPTAELVVDSDAGLLEIVAHGSIREGSGSASGGYEVRLEHDGKKKRVTGSFKRTYSMRKIRRGRARVASSSEFTYHVTHLPSLGKGRYRIELMGVDATLKDHLRVLVYTSRYDHRTLMWGVGILAVLGLIADVMTARVRHRTRLAQGAVIAGGFTLFFVLRHTPDAVMSTTLGGALVAILGGWVLGYVFGKLAKSIGREPVVAKAAAPDDE